MPSKNKKYYQNLISDHKKILKKAREIVSLMLDKLEEDIKNFESFGLDDENLDSEKNNFHIQQKFWWGDKESASSTLNRLTILLLKLIPLEQEISKLDLTKLDLAELEEITEKTKIPEDELEIINQYVAKYRSQQNI